MAEADDLFHDIIMSEEISQQQGFDEGRIAGRLAGIQEGNKLGWEKGAAIGSEVGFYGGYAQTLLEELENDFTAKPRAYKALQRIVVLVKEFPLTEPLNPELQTKMEEIRSKFKQVCAILGIKVGSIEDKDTTVNKGISF